MVARKKKIAAAVAVMFVGTALAWPFRQDGRAAVEGFVFGGLATSDGRLMEGFSLDDFDADGGERSSADFAPAIGDQGK
ncbi:MAG: hypothetical protein AAF961_18935, partial [Planctomycetota bacterium]